jgi:hypothetical protein
VASSLIAALAGTSASTAIKTTTTTTANSTTATTTTTHATTQVQTVAAAAASVPGGTTAVAVFVPVGAVATSSSASQSSGVAAVASAGSSAALTVAATPAAARPTQPLATPIAAAVWSPLPDEKPSRLPAPETPSGAPGLFLEPSEPRVDDETLELLVDHLTAPQGVWDAAIDDLLGGAPGVPNPSVMPLEAPFEDLDVGDLTSSTSAALAGAAVALWGVAEFRGRQTDEERRRAAVLDALLAQ